MAEVKAAYHKWGCPASGLCHLCVHTTCLSHMQLETPGPRLALQLHPDKARQNGACAVLVRQAHAGQSGLRFSML